MRLAVALLSAFLLVNCAGSPPFDAAPVPMGEASIYVVELGWHTDQAYTPEPAFATLLYGVAIILAGAVADPSLNMFRDA